MRPFVFRNSIALIGLVASLALSACDPTGASPEADGGVQPTDTPANAGFLGTWQYTSGTVLVSCSDGSNGGIPASGGTKTFTASATPGRVVATDEGCSLACDVTGDTVTCEQGTCSTGSGGTPITIRTDVFTLSGGELHETMNMEGVGQDGTTCEMSSVDLVLKKAQ